MIIDTQIPNICSSFSSLRKSSSCYPSEPVCASPAMPGRAVRAMHRAAGGVSPLRLPSLMPARCACQYACWAVMGWLAVPFILSRPSRSLELCEPLSYGEHPRQESQWHHSLGNRRWRHRPLGITHVIKSNLYKQKVLQKRSPRKLKALPFFG